VSLSERHAPPLAFIVPAPNSPVRIDDSEAKGDFAALFSGSNTGTSGEPFCVSPTPSATAPPSPPDPELFY